MYLFTFVKIESLREQVKRSEAEKFRFQNLIEQYEDDLRLQKSRMSGKSSLKFSVTIVHDLQLLVVVIDTVEPRCITKVFNGLRW